MSNNKKLHIKSLVISLLNDSHRAMNERVDKLLNSGALDIDNWNENDNSMILPKSIAIALLQEESKQYECKGTIFEKRIKKEVKNIKSI